MLDQKKNLAKSVYKHIYILLPSPPPCPLPPRQVPLFDPVTTIQRVSGSPPAPLMAHTLGMTTLGSHPQGLVSLAGPLMTTALNDRDLVSNSQAAVLGDIQNTSLANLVCVRSINVIIMCH